MLFECGICIVCDLCGWWFGLLCYLISIDFWCVVVLKGFLSVFELEGFGYGDVEWVDLFDIYECCIGFVLFMCGLYEYGFEIVVFVCGDVDVVFVKGVVGLEIVYLIDV